MAMKVNRTYMYLIAVGVIAYGAVVMTEDNARKGAPKRRNQSTASAPLPTGFTEEDLKVSFSPINESVKDAFRPIVVRKNSGSDTGLSPDAIPSVLTGGDPNWVYTGMAEVDSIPMGLLENKATGEGVFVKHSENWKSAEVAAISPVSLTLVGTNGRTYTMRLLDPEIKSSGGGSAPVQPNLRGPIGGALTVTPTPESNRNRIAGAPALEANNGN